MQRSLFRRILAKVPVILIMAFVLLPVVLVLWISFFSTSFISFPPPGYSLKWYANLLNQRSFVSAAILSVEVAVIATVISVAIGLMTALALSRMKRMRELLQTVFLSPLTVPSIVTGIAIYVMFTRVEQMFSANEWGNIELVPTVWLLVLGHVIITIPWAIRLISSGLVGIDRSLEEAALNLGATRMQAFSKVVLPQLRPSLVAASIFTFIVSFGNLEISLMLVAPGQSMLPIETLNYVIWNMDPTIAALSSVQVVLILVLLLIVDKVIGLGNVF